MYEREKSAESNDTEESLGSRDTDDEKLKSKQSEDKKWTHVDRSLREDAFKNLAPQKHVIQISQCGKCRSERNHAISVPFGPDYLIVINNCRECLATNIDIGKVYQKYWPKIEDREVQRVYHSKEGKYELEGDSGSIMNPLHRRILNNRLSIVLTQCNHCSERQLEMPADYFLRKNMKETYFLSYVQCLQCLSGNDWIIGLISKFWNKKESE